MAESSSVNNNNNNNIRSTTGDHNPRKNKSVTDHDDEDKDQDQNKDVTGAAATIPSLLSSITSRVSKKARLDRTMESNENNSNKEKPMSDAILLPTLWQHYRRYWESVHGGGGGGDGNEDDDDNDDDDDGSNGGGDFDELTALLELASTSPRYDLDWSWTTTSSSSSSSSGNAILIQWTDTHYRQLLCSVSHGILAEEFISQYIDGMLHPHQPNVLDDSNNNDDRQDVIDSQQHHDHEQHEALQNAVMHIELALQLFPFNASVWSLGANLARMLLSSLPHNNDDGDGVTSTTTNKNNKEENTTDNSHLADWLCKLVMAWYQQAIRHAVLVRHATLSALHLQQQQPASAAAAAAAAAPGREDDDSTKKNDASLAVIRHERRQEQMELLLLNQVAGVEYEGDDEDEEGEEEDASADEEKIRNRIMKQLEKVSKTIEEQKNEPERFFRTWSPSAVEGTARFMMATLLSTIGGHDAALLHLQAFGPNQMTHRIHPHVWQGSLSSALLPLADNDNNDTATDTNPAFTPVRCSRLRSNQAGGSPEPQMGGGILPDSLYERLLEVFGPNASYWRESGYGQRGYYSFFMPVPKNLGKDFVPGNLMEEILFQLLLPIAQETMKTKCSDSALEIKGLEWWVHTRPMQANLGHNLHFDTDEALLRARRNYDTDKHDESEFIRHPIVSSVLYLTGHDQAGPTIVLNQTPASTKLATQAWRNPPQNNSCLLFPGNLLHGVLPCQGPLTMARSNTSAELQRVVVPTANVSDLRKLASLLPPVPKQQQHRLTLMVGYWTRSRCGVLDDATDEAADPSALYSPSSPLPPATAEHSWVQQLEQGYGQTDKQKGSKLPRSAPIHFAEVPCITPAWEKIANDTALAQTISTKPLPIPKEIDHRFFVRDLPQCFRNSLFERDDEDSVASDYQDDGEDDSENYEDDHQEG